MSLIQRIRQYFRKGAVTIGAKKELQTVLDHPKIGMDRAEYARIQNSLIYYKGYVNCNSDKQSKANVNMAKKVAQEYAKVMFNEQAEITIGKESDKKRNKNSGMNEWIESVFQHNDFKKNLSRYLEPAMALGGLAVRPYVNTDKNMIEFSWALADAFYPLESNTNKISGCAIPFKTIRQEGKKTYYYTLLEIHEWIDGEYWIFNELYESEKQNVLGIQVSLKTLQQYENLEPSCHGIGIERPIFAYFRTAGFNNINPHSPLGVGVFDNCKRTLDRLNKALDAFDHEIDAGRRRGAFPESMMRGVADKETGQINLTYDPDDDYYVIVPGTDPDQFKVTDLTKDIRTEQYIGAVNHRLRLLEMEVGLSTGTFIFDGQGVKSTNKTATEVASENSQTYQSRNQQITQLEEFIRDVILAVCELGQSSLAGEKALFNGESPNKEEIGISFDDGIFLNKESEAEYYTDLYDSGLIPGWMAISKIMNIPEETAKTVYHEAQLGEVEKTTGNMPNSGIDDFEE
ncbi:hypothetical protein A5886_001814 [Enterococcus sp. 8G7_MSG3316]|uniref:Minor capsid protein n=1 Tax=Candidatus Enterococcus testudinis TaxID=1834191 RepID=A0A242A6S2_9ENTE|nr:phage portal protein [Enterococcus sp. 8G7_MSG3316]OTN76735.1 hypothetical protein A5886_001814 [Enterococcus sp. 8G7_MSG3316]